MKKTREYYLLLQKLADRAAAKNFFDFFIPRYANLNN